MRTALLGSPVVVLLSAMTSVHASQAGDALDATLLPDGWAWGDEAAEYNRDNVYEYLDGGAAFYLSYSLESLLVRSCAGPEGAAITVELYSFAPGGDSHGVFLNETRGERPTGPWDDAVYGAGLLKAREGRFILRVQSGRRGDALREPIGAIASAVCAKLGSSEPPPRLLEDARACVDPDAIVPNSERFFHTRDSLNSQYYLGPDNVLELSADTGCVLMHLRLGEGDARAVVLAVVYPEPGRAESAVRNLTALWGDLLAKGTSQIAPRDGGRWWGMTSAGKHLGIVLEADTHEVAEQALGALEAIAQRAEGKDDDDR